jgi:excisionase family DNA binding protein
VEQPEPNAFTLSTAQVADIFGVSIPTVIRWTKAGVLPFWRAPVPNSHRRFRPADVDRIREATVAE